ncbi:MAG: hypothetical protein L6Q71_12545, partial [Planctomycetes bacterium]|nr:hypothetical protein [Planctomycetota bacterium]
MRDATKNAEDAQAETRAEIIKEGLSEYYIYTVKTSKADGTETIPNGWAKSLQSFHVDNVPVEFVYTYNSRKYGTELRRVYSFVNDEAHNLGKEPLPGGVVRLYERKGNDGLGYVAALGTEYIPKGEEVKIVGDSDPNVTIEIKVMKYRRTNLNFRTKDEVKSLIGWDDVRDYVVVVKNFRGSAIKAEVTLNLSGDFEVAAADGTTLIHDSATTRKLKLNIPAGESSTSGFTLTVHNQENAKRGR